MEQAQAAFTIDEFCKAHRFSRAQYYVLKKLGKGPREMHVGGRRLISREAAADFRRSCEEDAGSDEAAA